MLPWALPKKMAAVIAGGRSGFMRGYIGSICQQEKLERKVPAYGILRSNCFRKQEWPGSELCCLLRTTRDGMDGSSYRTRWAACSSGHVSFEDSKLVIEVGGKLQRPLAARTPT